MMRVVHNGGLRGIAHRTFDLSEAAEAHKAMARRDVFGNAPAAYPWQQKSYPGDHRKGTPIRSRVLPIFSWAVWGKN